ncbi:MAG: EF-hand domain-containing protein [Brevundimonas sp.]|nr:EF-hand domain-containing protein [Brevundimonas sp.]
MRKTLLAGALAALTLAAGGVAVAQQAPDRPQAGALRADADGDRRLSRAEFVEARVQRLAAADADRDGSVTREEMRAVRQARIAARADARFDRLDADDDGVISKAEFGARRQGRAEARADRGPRRAHRGPARAGRMAGRGPVVIAEARARAEAGFARMDVDRDGYVTAAERRTARAAMREQRRERMVERRMARRAQQASPPAPASE